MGRRKKKTRFDAGKQTRRLARAVLGPPPRERVLPSRKSKRPKHKKRELERELES